MSSDPTTPTRKFRLPAQATESLGLLAVLAVLILVFSIAGKNFFSSATLKQIANEIPALAVISVGMTFVIITAGIDLSVGSVMAFSGAILGLAMADWEVCVSFCREIDSLRTDWASDNPLILRL